MAAGALEVMDEGAVTLAVGSWKVASSGAAGSGFVDDANLVINTPGNQPIVGGLDWSALGTSDGTDGLYALDIVAPFAGHVGTDAAGPLIVAISGDAYSESARNCRLNYAAAGTLRYSAGAGVCQWFQLGGAGKAFLMGGTMTYLTQDDGELKVNQSVAFTDAGRLSLMGGTGTIDTHASDLIGQLTAGGRWSGTLKRGGIATNGILRIEDEASLTLDCGAAAWPIIIGAGGTLTVLSVGAPGTTAAAGGGTATVLGNEASCEIRGGMWDFRRLNRPLALTARTYSAATIKGANNPLLTLTNLKQGAGATLG